MKTLTREDIDGMTEVEKLELIFELEKSLGESSVPLTPEQEAELDRRMEAFDNQAAEAVTWEAYKAKRAQRLA